MKRMLLAAFLAASLAGCRDDEAERFGYRGKDLAETERLYFTSGDSVTNWVPMRVLLVSERYELADDERRFLDAAGVVMPGGVLDQVPEGYVRQEDEPWFESWRKDAEAFGCRGVLGFVAHYDAEKGVRQVGETYFSTYHEDRSAARRSLAALRTAVATAAAPKRFHDFEDAFVAEYVRLRVIAMVGRRQDGQWTCMLNIQDKCNQGCGQWQPVEAQRELAADEQYRQAMKKWREDMAKVSELNHAAVEKKRAALGLELFGKNEETQKTGDGRLVHMRFGARPAGEIADRAAFWRGLLDGLGKAAGVVFAGERSEIADDENFEVWFQSATNGLYEVRLDVAFPRSSTNAVAAANAEWRELCVERMQGEVVIPERPVRRPR